ncbi:nucleolar pre-ribosomal-associated protein 1-like isoform X1 [Camellia sinensis]|uniref:nucleolar pre-ribosomal-associated protein 1-like isoform X1 n=1 Tax=Camellia sinensis TaxID=4442 RepID=UPI001036AD3C|nr:nucleolar pre-ribosomal-associated protein 1-like isoform X1 [Camellia sinensis]
MSSILRLLVVPSTDQSALNVEMSPQNTYELSMKRLEVVKLLRALFHFTSQQCGFDFKKDISVNSRELVFLLLSSYGATLSEVDLEIYDLMFEIESASESNSGSIAEMDYLWGAAAIKVRKEREQEQDLSSVNMNDVEAVEERRRSQFRENLPVDPKVCATTVLHFPYDRTVSEGTLFLSKYRHDNSETPYANVEKILIYDPVFILRFSIHSLSMGYIEPMEFASLGLLAIAFVSISSPHDEMRKLGYEALERFKTALERCQKREGLVRLRLLLTYLQNGIEDPWQEIPSIIAMFVAEASFILLDSSHDHYLTISNFLLRYLRVNVKCIPLFETFFLSSTVKFKTLRLWILRLLYAGLNSDDDAQIYIRNKYISAL